MNDRDDSGTQSVLELAGHRVRLREFRTDDTDDVLSVVGDDRITRFLSFDSRNRDQAQAMIDGTLRRTFDDPRIEYYLAVTDLRNPDVLIGFVRLGLTGVKAAKIGYAIAAKCQGNGYATDAVHTMLAFAFNTLNLHRVTAAIGPGNAASVAVVDRLGFTREGILRDHVFTNGAWRDSELYSLISHEYQASTRC